MAAGWVQRTDGKKEGGVPVYAVKLKVQVGGSFINSRGCRVVRCQKLPTFKLRFGGKVALKLRRTTMDSRSPIFPPFSSFFLRFPLYSILFSSPGSFFIILNLRSQGSSLNGTLFPRETPVSRFFACEILPSNDLPFLDVTRQF